MKTTFLLQNVMQDATCYNYMGVVECILLLQQSMGGCVCVCVLFVTVIKLEVAHFCYMFYSRYMGKHGVFLLLVTCESMRGQECYETALFIQIWLFKLYMGVVGGDVVLPEKRLCQAYVRIGQESFSVFFRVLQSTL